jgi:pyochelin biosynthetic protein PchC
MSAWLRRPGPAPDAAARLVCLPHAGGSAAFYQPLAERLRPAIDTAVIQYPGRHDRFAEPAYTDLDLLARDVAAALRREVATPFALFGRGSCSTRPRRECSRRECSRRPGLSGLACLVRRRRPDQRP